MNVPNKDSAEIINELDAVLAILRREFVDCSNINNFLLSHQKISQLFTRRLQLQMDRIPELANKQVREININVSPEAANIINALNSEKGIVIDSNR